MYGHNNSVMVCCCAIVVPINNKTVTVGNSVCNPLKSLEVKSALRGELHHCFH